MPYMGVEVKLCEAAWNAFSARDSQTLDFHGEQNVIDEVHTEADRELLRSMREGEGEIWDKMRRAMVLGETATRRELIRDASDSRTLLVHDHPDKLGNPFQYRGFSIFIGSLLGKYEELEQWAQEHDVDWLFKFPQEAEGVDEEDSRSTVEYLWHNIRSKDELKFSPLLVVHPKLVEYDKDIGFRFSPKGNADPEELNKRVLTSWRRGSFNYQLEDYPHHVQEMVRVFESKWRDRLQFAVARLEQKQGWSKGSIEHVTRLAIACHDVGKMDVRWQKWAHNYQEAIGKPVNDPAFMIAHTHSQNDEHRRIAKEIRPKRPHHAGEAAVAVAKLVNDFFDPWPEAREALRKITLSAIARHHSAQTDSFDEKYALANEAHQAIFAALHSAGVAIPPEVVKDVFTHAPTTQLEKQILSNGDRGEWWLAYFLIVRALRMCDGESQEEG